MPFVVCSKTLILPAAETVPGTLVIAEPAKLGIITVPVPFASIVKSILLSSPVAAIVGPEPVAELVTVISLTAEEVATNFILSLPLASNCTVLASTLSCVHIVPLGYMGWVDG